MNTGVEKKQIKTKQNTPFCLNMRNALVIHFSPSLSVVFYNVK